MLNLSQEALNRHRLHLLKKQITHAYKHVPYYTKYFQEHDFHPSEIKGLSDLIQLPIIDKEIIRQDQTLFINNQYPANKYHKSYSSGSTGEPFTSYFNTSTWLRKKYFSKIRARKECGLRFGEKIAIFETEDSIKLKHKNKKIGSIKLPYDIQYFSIFADPVDTLRKIAQFDPQNFYGPPSYIFQLAQKQKAHSFVNLKRIFTASEYLDGNVRSYLEGSFQAYVYDHYGCTETKEVAWQCQERGGYHINEDEMILEIVDGERVLPDDNMGDIVLTDLRNRAMPFIRYRIGDKGILLNDRCSCGRNFKLMRPLAGRASEYVVLPDGEQLSPYLFTTAIEHISGLLKYQIIQLNKNQVNTKVIVKSDQKISARKQIQETIQTITKNKLTITIELCESLPIETNGKFKVVKNLMIHHGAGEK